MQGRGGRREGGGGKMEEGGSKSSSGARPDRRDKLARARGSDVEPGSSKMLVCFLNFYFGILFFLCVFIFIYFSNSWLRIQHVTI